MFQLWTDRPKTICPNSLIKGTKFSFFFLIILACQFIYHGKQKCGTLYALSVNYPNAYTAARKLLKANVTVM